MAKLTGGCLCGDIRYIVSIQPERASYCHCGMCRKSSGSPYTGWFTIPATALRWTNAEPAVYKSSPQASRSHCRRCGSQITYQWGKNLDFVTLTIGSLDIADAVKPTKHIMWADRVPGLELNDGLPKE